MSHSSIKNSRYLWFWCLSSILTTKGVSTGSEGVTAFHMRETTHDREQILNESVFPPRPRPFYRDTSLTKYKQ